MKTKDLLKYSIEFSSNRLFTLLEDMKENPLVFPTPNGGNHPLWVVGHLAYIESLLVQKYMLGGEHPLKDWADMFGIGSEPVDDPAKYPSYEEVVKIYKETNSKTLEILDSLSEEDMDQASKNCPDGYEDFIGTYWKILLTVGLHASFHKGQVADSRRALGKKPAVI